MAELFGTYDGWLSNAPEPVDDDDDEPETVCTWCNRPDSHCCCP
jgi:hypothetical protein